MRRIVVTEYVSLDGVFEEPGVWSGPWWSDEAGQFKYDELMTCDTQLLGRLTYEGFAAAWPKMEEATGDFGKRMNGMPKYVVSTTLQKADWTNSHIISENVVDEIKKLKEQPGQDILVAGSGKLVETLRQHDLVDEIRFMVHPVILGQGKRLFTGDTIKQPLKLVETKPLPKGIVVLTYQPDRSATQ